MTATSCISSEEKSRSPNSVLRRVFKAFHYREFRLLWVGACTSSIGTWMQIVAQSWLVLSISGSAFMLGLDGFLGQIPILLFSLIGGVIADRIDRRRVLLGSQYVQMTCAFLLTLLIVFKRRQGLAYPDSFIRGGLRAVFRRTRLSGAGAHAGGERRPAQRHRAQFHPVQPGARNRPDAGRHRANQPGSGLVLRAQRLSFVAVIISLLLLTVKFRAEVHRRVDTDRREAGHRVHAQSGRNGRR